MLRLAIRMLVGDTTKWLGVVLGVLFCAFLITHMLSMFAGMMARTFALVSDIPFADVWVMDPAVEYTDEPAGMPPTALRRVQSAPGVEWAVPLYTGTLRARLPNGRFRGVLVIGVDDASLIGAPEELTKGRIDDLRGADAAIVDEEGARTLLRMPVSPQMHQPGWNRPDLTGQTRPLGMGDELLLNDHRLKIVGMTELGPRLISKPVVYTTYSRALGIAPPERNLLSFVLVKVKPGEDHQAAARRIESATGLKARTAREFKEDTFWYFVETTGVVGRILFMVVLAAVVGSAVSALLLYVFTNDNLKYYGVLKALGAANRTVAMMVVAQAAVCGLLGFGLGVGLSVLLSHVVSRKAMPYLLMWPTMGATLLTVMVVCMLSALLSARKVAKLEPGIVFRV